MIEPIILGQFSFDLYDTTYNVNVIKTKYTAGPIAICLIDSTTEEDVCTLSTNLHNPEYQLKENEFFAKTWSENEDIAKAALQTGLFEDTGVREPTGFVEAQVWRIKV